MGIWVRAAAGRLRDRGRSLPTRSPDAARSTDAPARRGLGPVATPADVPCGSPTPVRAGGPPGATPLPASPNPGTPPDAAAPAPGRPTARPLEAGAPTYPHPLTRPASPHDHPTRRGGPRARRPTARPLEADYPDRRTRPCLLTTTPPLATRTYVR